MSVLINLGTDLGARVVRALRSVRYRQLVERCFEESALPEMVYARTVGKKLLSPSQRWNDGTSAVRELLTRFAGLLRSRPFDREDAVGRARERHRRAVLSMLASMAGKGLSAAATLIVVPLALGYLGSERYGIWMTLSATVALLNFADLGLGYGLINVLSGHGGDDEKARRAVSSTVALLTLTALVLAGVALVLWDRIPFAALFGAKSTLAMAEAGPAAAVLLGFFLANLPTTVAEKTLLARQEGYLASLWSGFGALVGLILIWFAIGAEAGLPWLVAAAQTGPLLANLINCLHLFGLRLPRWRPGRAWVSLAAGRRLAGLGLLFLVIQVAGALAYQSDHLILARILGPEAVTVYSVALRLFMQVPVLLSFVLMPLWPAYGEALATGDLDWIRRTVKRSLAAGLAVAVPAAVVLVATGRSLIVWWASPAAEPPRLLLLALGVWICMSAVNGAMAMLLNGMGRLKFQAATSTAMALVNVALSILLTLRWGVSGVVWGSVLAQIVCMYVPFAFYLPRLWRSLGGSAAEMNGMPGKRVTIEKRSDRG